MRDVERDFADIDPMTADAFVTHLTENVTFRLGSAELCTAAHGRRRVWRRHRPDPPLRPGTSPTRRSAG
jgi:hypothetical protein